MPSVASIEMDEDTTPVETREEYDRRLNALIWRERLAPWLAPFRAYRDVFKERPVMTILATIGAIWVIHTQVTAKDRFMETCMEDASKRYCEAEWEQHLYETDASNGAL